jgi:hypothetical protein
MTKAMPLSFGTRDRKRSKASNPPAEAPMPTMGKETRRAGGCGFFVFLETALASVLRRRSGEDLFFTILFRAAVELDETEAATASAGDATVPTNWLWCLSEAIPPRPDAGQLPVSLTIGGGQFPRPLASRLAQLMELDAVFISTR